jgi:hypothetical protein
MTLATGGRASYHDTALRRLSIRSLAKPPFVHLPNRFTRAVLQMSAPKRARHNEAAAAAAGGAGGAPPPPPPPARRRPPTRSVVAAAVAAEAYERRLKLTDVIGFVAQNGYAREADACAGLCRETWRCIPPGLSAADADRVRRDHPLWQAIIDLKHGKYKETRLCFAASFGRLSHVRELCDWRADIEAVDKHGFAPLFEASKVGHIAVVRELLARGANVEAATNNGSTSLFVASQNGLLVVVRELLACGANIEAATNAGFTSLLIASQEGQLDVVCELLARGANVNAATTYDTTPLIQASWCGHVEVVRALLAAGADKRLMQDNGSTAISLAGTEDYAPPGSRATLLALLAAAP